MAATAKSRAGRQVNKRQAPAKTVNEPTPVEPVVSSGSTQESVEEKHYRVKKNLDPNTIVTVRNGFQGKLIYRSKRTQERFVWNEFGDEQDMELSELKNAKNSSKGFFENNYFMIDDPEIIEYLGVEKYYKNALDYKSFDELFNKSGDEVTSIIAGLSKGQKRSVAYRAKQMIAEGKIDSLKTITALEEALSIELIER